MQKAVIRKEVEAAGGEMEAMPLNKFVPTEIPLGMDLKTIGLYEDILNAEVLINVPIAKHHADAKLTLGMKNLMGVMSHRLIMYTNMAQRLADLNSRIRPTLNVMDAVRMLMDWGPTGGSLGDVKKIDTVVVSQDIVALDSYTATLFDKKPTDLDYVNTLGMKMIAGRYFEDGYATDTSSAVVIPGQAAADVQAVSRAPRFGGPGCGYHRHAAALARAPVHRRDGEAARLLL